MNRQGESHSQRPAEGNGFEKNANAIVIAKKGFDDFLYCYRNWHLTHRATRTLAWLPVVWPDELNDDHAGVKAQFAGCRISFSQKTPTTAGLILTLQEGTFTCGTTDIEIDHWTIPLAGTISLTAADSLTEDSYPYYQSAYEKLKKIYTRIQQFSLDLTSLKRSGAIDYNGCQPTADQQDVFADMIGRLLSRWIQRHTLFVLAYLGGYPETKEIPEEAIECFYPFHTGMEVYGEGDDSEVRFPYRWLFPFSTWRGDTDRLLVPDRVEGIMILGREVFFRYLAAFFSDGDFIGTYEAEQSGGKLTRITFDDGNGSYLLTLKDNEVGFPVLQLKCDLSFSSSFQMPDLGSRDKSHTAMIRCRAKRTYELAFRLDDDSGFLKVGVSETSGGGIAELHWIEQEQTLDLLTSEYKAMYDSVVSGTTSEAAAKSIAALCLQAPFLKCADIQNAYEKAFQGGHQAYIAVMNFLDTKDRQMKLPTGLDTRFFEFAQDEIFSCQKLRFDDQWNLLVNLAYKPKPGSGT